jgi:tetratricopeptide (TPR) repeat protein/transcriptional regulator with XRE-family HTH domain
MDKNSKTTPNSLLRRERELRSWTQRDVGDKVGVDSKLVSAWERGVKFPTAQHRHQLCELFAKSPVELGFYPVEAENSNNQQVNRPLHEREQPFPPVWNVPYDQNPVFTGREHVLQQLYASLVTGKAAALTQAISGLGGVGKTQIAVEYCYRHRCEYKAVLWATADTRDELLADLISIAKLLKLPESRSKDQQPIFNALRKWMREQPHWLLVLDNVESVEIVKDIIPPARRGHILVTTRTQATGTYPKINVQDMEEEEGALLVLRRANILAYDVDLGDAAEKDREIAGKISRELGGLPLALDQAGAYIQETECSLSAYLDRYKIRRAELLGYRGASDSDHPHSVATTLSLSFEQIARTNATAADLLRACALLHPDAIPEEFFTRGAEELGIAFQPLVENPVAIDQVIGEILKYSLIRRNTRDTTLAIHRLVQAVLLDNMDNETQHMWAERLVKAVNKVLQLDVTFTNLPEQRYLLQAWACTKLINEWNFPFLEAAQLITAAGKYMRSDGYYMQAEQHCSKALDMFRRLPGASATDTYRCLTLLVLIKADHGDFIEAETLCERLRTLSEETFGLEHPFTVFSHLYLADLYMKRGKFEQAEPLVTSALTTSQSAPLPRDYPISDILVSLAKLYSNQNKVTLAETLYQEALTRAEQTFGAEHSKIADILSEMAIHYSSQHENTKEKRLRKRATGIYKKLLPPDHPDLAIALTGLYLMYFFQNRSADAEEYYEQAMEIWKRKIRDVFTNTAEGAAWPDGISKEPGNSSQRERDFQRLLFPEEIIGEEQGKEAATISIRLANSFLEQGKFDEAETLFWNAQHIAEKTLGKEDLVTVYCLGDLAKFYQTQKQFQFAEFLYERALQLAAVKFKFAPAGTRQIFENYKQFLRETGQDHHADELQRQFDMLKNQNH